MWPSTATKVAIDDRLGRSHPCYSARIAPFAGWEAVKVCMGSAIARVIPGEHCWKAAQ